MTDTLRVTLYNIVLKCYCIIIVTTPPPKCNKIFKQQQMALPMSLSRKKESIWHKVVSFSARPIKWGGFIKLLTNGAISSPTAEWWPFWGKGARDVLLHSIGSLLQ